MSEADEAAAAQPRRTRTGLWVLEAGLLAIIVGLGAYGAGVRNGIHIEKRRAERSEAGPSPHEHAMPPAEAAMPPMDKEALKARLAGFSHQELLEIANQHLDQARAASDSEDPEASARRFTIAVAAYEKALELQPEDPDVLTDLGIALRGLGDAEGAVQRFREAAKLDPKHVQSRFNLGLVLLHDLGRKEEAAASWEEYLEVAPKDDELRPMVEQELKQLRR